MTRFRKMPIFCLALGLLASPARAGTFYVNNSVGLSQMRTGETFFGSSFQSPTTFGLNFGLGLFWGIGSGKNPVDFQIGFEPRLSMSSDANAAYGLLSLYPIARFQASRLYLGFGISPFVYSRQNASAGFDDFHMVAGTMNWMVEGGFLLPVTPEFSMAVGAMLELTKSAAGTSPTTYSGIVSMRYYFAQTGSAKSSQIESNEFKGWRYPFGNMR